MTDRLWPLYSETELGDIPQPKWLVGGAQQGFVTDGFTVMYGPPKSGKTFMALDWALSMATGAQWNGHPTEQAPVLYVSGEGAGGLHKRVTAWKMANGQKSSRLYFIPFGARIVERDHVVQLKNDVHATGARLLVIDTLARSMAGKDENSAQDMGMSIQALDWIREKTGCGTLVLHHSGVDGTRPRGSTALFGAADTLIRVEGEGNMMKLSCEGQKDAMPFRPVHFQLKTTGPSVVLSPVSAMRDQFASQF
jgi:KaiC/GvpD/RAD55 family RecA-like ATPase